MPLVAYSFPNDALSGYFTTLFTSLSAQWAPNPVRWISEATAPPKPTQTQTSGPVQGNIFFPNVGWIDLDRTDGNNLPEFYSWGAAGLLALTNVAGAIGQQAVELIAPSKLSAMVPQTQLLLGDLTGDGQPEAFLLSFSQQGNLVPSFLLGQPGALSANTFGPEVSFNFEIDPSVLPQLSLARENGKQIVSLAFDDYLLPLEYGKLPPLDIIPYNIPGLRVPGVEFPAGNFFFVDQNGDGQDELFVFSGLPGSPSVSVHPYEQGSATQGPRFSPTPSDTIPLDCGPDTSQDFRDLNQDGWLDYVCVKEDRILARIATGPFQLGPLVESRFPFTLPIDPALQATFPTFWGAYFELADMTGDGKVDYVNYTFTDKGELWLRPNLGDGSFGPLQMIDTGKYQGLNQAYGFNLVDIDGAGPAEFALADANSSADGGQKIHILKFQKLNLDADLDGIADVKDNCVGAGAGNTDQKDSDKDGIGDACDPVPCGPDDDNDGIPEAITSPDPACQLPTDNCKGTPNAPAPNTSQANCNALAEAANGAVVLGDACDPVPCASPQPLQITDDDKKPVVTVSANGTIVQVGPLIRTYSINRLDVKTTGQNPAPGHGNAVEKAIQVSETSYRYCLEGAGFACDDPALFNDPAKISQAAPFRAQEGVPSLLKPWRRISVQGLTAPGNSGLFDGVDLGPGQQGRTYQSGSDYTRLWYWKEDFNAWDSFGGQIQGFSRLFGSPGLLAIHAKTTAGEQDDPAYGFHPLASDPTKAAKNLSIGTVWVNRPARRDALAHLISPSAMRALLCVGSAEGPCSEDGGGVLWMPPERKTAGAKPGCDENLCLTTRPRQSLPLWRFPGFSEYSGVLEEDGAVRDVSESLDDETLALLSNGTLLLSPAEPSPDIQGKNGYPDVIGVSADYQPTALLGWHEGKLRATDAGCGRRCAPLVAAKVTSAPRPSQAIYTRALGALFVAGADPAGGAPGDILRWRRLSDPGWNVVALPEQEKLGEVLAMTYSVYDGKVWLLHETGKGGWKTAHLIRVDPFSGATDQVGSWKKVGVMDRHWLVVDRDDRVLLVASSKGMNKHVIAERVNDFETVGTGVLSTGRPHRLPWGWGRLRAAPTSSAHSGVGGGAVLVTTTSASGGSRAEPFTKKRTGSRERAC